MKLAGDEFKHAQHPQERGEDGDEIVQFPVHPGSGGVDWR
jgi:hypothetical protein